MDDKNSAEPENQQSDSPGKRPYTKPAFRFESVFVVSALSCGKIDPTQKHCTFSRKVS